MKISEVSAFQIFDSRGNPTVEAEVVLEGGMCGHGLVPSGASTGQYEALELRDQEKSRFRGKSVGRAIGNVNGEIAQAVRGMEAGDQAAIDRALIDLDGTPNKSRLGANAILAVSLAVANAAAAAKGKPLFESLGGADATLLPLPEVQIIGGGAHADWRTDVQDFLVIATGAQSYPETLEISFNIYQAAREVLRERKKYFGIADEGGFWPEFTSNEEILQVLVEAIQRAGYTPGKEASISLDIAASDLFDEATGKYHFRHEGREFSSEQFAELMIRWCDAYPIISIEDPMADTDWAGWRRIHAALGGKIQLIGDDLFTTNLQRIRKGIEEGVANAVLIKLNQVGTVTETLDAVRLTQEAGWLPVISGRSGETEDAFISHLAVATNAGQIKVGSFARSERMVKWNEVLRIHRTLGERSRFEGALLFNKIREPREKQPGEP
jgi:enolase